ncbi:LysR substrate-binding domain-containing protein [Neisseriaceae bacterium JH1-16]|nr:LysR substrate-binding domain-containing protein [Neisseriaceae bacterium JH1-16]
MDKLPPLHALRVFVTVVRCKSFSRAAEELFLTQSAVSHQVRNLERHLGFAVFDRASKSPLLTGEGEILFETAHQALAMIGQTCASLAEQHNAIRLRSSPSFAVRWLVPRLGDFYRRHPDIQIHLTTVWENEPYFRWDLYDLVIHYAPLTADGVAIHVEQITPVCSPALLAELGSPPSLERLAEQLLIHPSRDQHDWRCWFEAIGRRWGKVQREQFFDTDHMALEAASRGIGLTIADPLLIREDLLANRLCQPFPDYASTGNGYLVFSADRSFGKRQHMTVFLDWLVAELAGEGQALSRA